MIQLTPETERFKRQLRDSLKFETLNNHSVKFASDFTILG